MGSYLSGSFARQTAIRPLDDMDVVLLIDHTQWDTPLFSSLPSSRKALKSFERAVRCRNERSSVRMQRRSLGLLLYVLNVDVMPAIPAQREPYILLPDYVGDNWKLSAPFRPFRLFDSG